jgi:hypothetical protein
MNIGGMAKTRGIFLLAVLILFPITGIHSDICHIAHSSGWQAYPEFSGNSIFVGSTGIHPESGQCTSCFFNQLLTQAMFPVVRTVFVSQTASYRERIFPKVILGCVLEHAVNRGPPAAIAMA